MKYQPLCGVGRPYNFSLLTSYFLLLTSYFLLLTSYFLLLKVLYKMTTPAANNHILHTLIPQRLVVQVMHMQMFFAPAQNALAIVMGEKLLPLNMP